MFVFEIIIAVMSSWQLLAIAIVAGLVVLNSAGIAGSMLELFSAGLGCIVSVCVFAIVLYFVLVMMGMPQ